MTPAAWVTGDEVYGNSPGLPADLEVRQLAVLVRIAGRRRRIEEAFQASTAPATTDDSRTGPEDHDLRLQYQAPPRPRPGAPGIARVD